MARRSSGSSSPTRCSMRCRRTAWSGATARLQEVFVEWRDGGFADVEGDAVDNGSRRSPRRRGDRARRRPARRDLSRGRRLDRRGRRRPAARAPAARSITAIRPQSSTTQPAGLPGPSPRTSRQQVHDDPYRAIGRQDLTAHVDVTAVERAAARAGLVHLGTTTQGELPRSARRGRAARRAPVGAEREPPGLPRGTLSARPDDRSGSDGRLPRDGVRARPPWRPDAARIRLTNPKPTELRLTTYRLAHRGAGRLARRSAAPVPRPPHRRGADRELARALGAIRSPTFHPHSIPGLATAPAARCRARAAPRAARTTSPARMNCSVATRVSARAPPRGALPTARRAHHIGSTRGLLGVNVG